MQRLKVITIVGTRPEIIRLSRVMNKLDEFTEQIIVHTGQNYDYELNEIFWNDLELRKPDHFLNADTSSLGATLGDILNKTEKVLKEAKPDALLVLGDTNSCLSAYIAKRMHIPVFHMEAGNRSFDMNVPEETNRKIIDHLADFNLVYTEHARRHLLAEGLSHRRIYLTGSPMKEVLDYYKNKIQSSKALSELDLVRKGYFLVSVHREENVDNADNLRTILSTMNAMVEKYNLPLIVSTHPRTRKRIENIRDQEALELNPLIQFMKPFGFFDYINLQMNAQCVISDSGTISEESSILGFPAISLRQSMERPEAQDTGSMILSGLHKETVIPCVEYVTQEFTMYEGNHPVPADYTVTDTSNRVVKLILGNTKLSNKWWGINQK
ncbi:MAG: UDP-N-acetylglucosamine 2-epimerase (non-hydrolyzing) [Brumimicrobium sp.]|nr:UDP-N-acetylglucosamine 2-epimerase (non-hydrolyzing) [Brumimicrobium sp.]